jgi:hypothetical protein
VFELSSGEPARPKRGINVNRFIFGLCLLFVACHKDVPSTAASTQQPQTAAGPQNVHVEDASGQPLYGIKWRDDGAELQNAQGQDTLRFKLNEDRLKIRTATDEVLGYVTGGADNLKIKDAAKAVLFELKRQDDGDYKVVDGADVLLYKLKVKEGAVKVVNAAEVVLYKAKLRETKVVLRTEDDKDLLTAKHSQSTLAASVLGLDKLTELQRQALFVRMTELKLP